MLRRSLFDRFHQHQQPRVNGSHQFLRRRPTATALKIKERTHRHDDRSWQQQNETALTQAPRFVSDSMALNQRAKVLSVHHDSDQRDNRSLSGQEGKSESRSFSQSTASGDLSAAPVSRSVVSRPSPALEMSRGDTGSSRRRSNPVESLPSATLLRRTLYADALKLSSPSPLADVADRDAAMSSREAATIRLQSYAHHEKLIPSVTSQHDEAKTALMRCRKCGHVFAHGRGKMRKNLREQQANVAVVRSRALVAMATSRPDCVNCKSSEVESLLQYIHLRNNARKF